MKSKIITVDENDNILGYKERGTLKRDDIYRVSALWITNSDGDVLLAQRALTKSNDPGKWGPAVAGTVDEGEDYETNIIKEAEEEIGLKNIKPKIAHKERVSGEHNYFGQWYTLEVDQPINEFVIDSSEVKEIKWFSKKELLKEIQNIPDEFLKSMEHMIKSFCK